MSSFLKQTNFKLVNMKIFRKNRHANVRYIFPPLIYFREYVWILKHCSEALACFIQAVLFYTEQLVT